MKKLMMLVMLGVVASGWGATMTWTTTGFYIPETSTIVKTTTDLNKVMFYLVYTTDGVADVSASGSGISLSGDSVIDAVTVTKNAGSSRVLLTASDATGNMPSGTWSYYVLAVYDTAGSASLTSADYYWVSAVYSNGSTPNWDSTNPADNVTLTSISGKDGANASTAWTAVPEPTSMALISLGLVALGLRRKFKK